MVFTKYHNSSERIVYRCLQICKRPNTVFKLKTLMLGGNEYKLYITSYIQREGDTIQDVIGEALFLMPASSLIGTVV